MSTTVQSLVDRVRDALGDYPDTSTTTSAEINSSATSVTVASGEGIAAGAWLMIGYEMLYVSAVSSGPPVTLTVRRGQRGSTAATQTASSVVWVGPKRGNHAILRALNAALARLTKAVSDVTLTITADDSDYSIPSTVKQICRVEIESAATADQYYPTRNWELLSATTFRIYGDFSSGLGIKVVGTNRFTDMATTGNLDSTFPDTSTAALEYLYYDALGHLLLTRQAPVADLDSFQGITDSFQANIPDFPIKTARFYLAEAERFKRQAIADNPILQPPDIYVPSATRRYLSNL